MQKIPKYLSNSRYYYSRTYAFFHEILHNTHCRRGYKPRLQGGLRKSCIG